MRFVEVCDVDTDIAEYFQQICDGKAETPPMGSRLAQALISEQKIIGITVITAISCKLFCTSEKNYYFINFTFVPQI